MREFTDIALLHDVFDGYPYLNSPEIKICKLSEHSDIYIEKLAFKNPGPF